MLLGKFVPIFNSLFDIKNHIGKFSAEKPERFFEHGIFKLREGCGTWMWNVDVEGCGTKWHPCNKCISNRNVNQNEPPQPFESVQSIAKIRIFNFTILFSHSGYMLCQSIRSSMC